VVTFMLLASALPFHGGERRQIAKAILGCKYKFKGKRWKRVSPEAKAFISDLLVLDPDKRLDAESALRSDWLNMYLPSAPTSATRAPRAEEEEMARSSMLKYAGYPKLKKMVSRNQRLVVKGSFDHFQTYTDCFE